MHFVVSNSNEMKLWKFWQAPSTQWSERRLASVIGVGFLSLWLLSMAVIWARWASERSGIEHEMQRYAAVALRAKATEVEGILLRTYHVIRTISMLPGVRGAAVKNRNSVEKNAQELGWIGEKEYGAVQQLYNQIASSVSVSEIYVVQDGFRPDQGQVPFMMFDEIAVQNSRGVKSQVSVGIEPDRPIEDETEEYLDFVRQLDLLRSSVPKIPANAPEGILPIISREIRTCDNAQYKSIAHGNVKEANGFSLSVPVYSIHEGQFNGIVTAMLRRNIFEAALRGIPVAQVIEQPGEPVHDGARRTQYASPSNYVLEQQSTAMRIFDRNNPYLKTQQGIVGDVFFRDSIELNLPGRDTWKLQIYVSNEQRLEGFAAGQWAAISQATLLTLALLMAWLFVHILLRQQMAARRQAESQTDGLIDDLKQQTQIANAASLAKSQFLANMSHEIRTPMNAILGMLTLLQKTELSASQFDYATKSEGAARSLLGLLNELLDFSKIEAGKMALDTHPFSLDSTLRDLSVILSANVGEKPIELIFDIDPTVPAQLMGDAMRLHQVLLNLGSNATKFTERGEVVLAIKVMQRSEEAATLRFSIKDSGMGIAADDQVRIFGGFSQAEASTTRRFGGTGLGLPISKHFVSLMGGQLELESEPNKGSLFYFTITLPVVAANLDGEDAYKQKPGAIASPETTQWRALFVDDNATVREALRCMGQSLGWQVDTAQGCDDAMELLHQSIGKARHYQAIYVDWSLPGIGGWNLVQNVRTLLAEGGDTENRGNTLVVLLVTAHERELLSNFAPDDQALVDGTLVKPVTASMLLDAVADVRNESDPVDAFRAIGVGVQRRLEGMRLLLVEDNLNNQQVASELLRCEGAHVQIANNGREGVEAVAAAVPRFDVVLMDLQMPVMDGFNATRVIRYDMGLKDLPIVAMTANAMASDVEACLAAGMNDHVGKPFDLTHLVQVLRQQAKWANAPVEMQLNQPVLSQSLVRAAFAGGIDLAQAVHRMGGNQDVYLRMLQTFINDLEILPEQMKESSPENLRRLMHTLKGLAATLGVSDLSSEAAAAEKIMRSGQTPDEVGSATHAVCEAILRAVPGVQGVLKALQDEQAIRSAHHVGASSTEIDYEILVAKLQALSHLLQIQDMEAMTAMAELQGDFATAMGEDLAALEIEMANLEFEKALEVCEALLSKYSK
jgi:signal transduction histidine kinase/CheY-like chemotaxis protein/HPt (histidine-containing phosphotransfer) domain-containing protein